MTFPVFYYAFWGIITPVMGALILLLLAALICRKMLHSLPSLAYVPLFLWAGIVFYATVTSIGSIAFPIGVLTSQGKTTYRAIGQIEVVRECTTLPFYYSNGIVSGGEFISIQGKTFFLPAQISLQQGQWVQLEYADNRAVLACEELQSDDNRTQFPIMDMKISKASPTTSESAAFIGQNIINVCVWAFCGIVAIQFLLGKRIVPCLEKRDAQVNNVVRPSKVPLLGYIDGILLAVGFWLRSGSAISRLCAGLLALVIILALLIKQTTYVNYSSNQFTVCVLGIRRDYQIKQVKACKWGYSLIAPRGRDPLHYSRTLILTFETGRKLYLEQSHYWGLSEFYSFLQKQY